MQDVKAWLGAHTTAVGAGLAVAAGVVLVAAAVVLAGVIGDQVAVESGAPSASPSPSSTQTPQASGTPDASDSAEPTAVPVAWHGYQLRDVASPLFGGLWTRVAVDRLNIRAAASTGAAVVGVAQQGDLLRVTGDPAYADDHEWAPVVANGASGWVAASDAGDPYLQPVATPWLYGSRRMLTGVVGSDMGVLAYGASSDLEVLPYEGSSWRTLLLGLEGGADWHATGELGGPASAAVAAGAFYVLAIEPWYIEPNLVRVSSDGASWSEGTVISFTARSGAVGPAGPVLIGREYGGPAYSATVAADGSVQEHPIPNAGEISEPLLEASGAGYVAFDRAGTPRLLLSGNGRTWSQVTVPGAVEGTHAIRDVELNGAQLVVAVVDLESGATSLRYGLLQSGTSVSWETGQPTPFGSATVDSIALGGGSYLALGWDRDELLPRVWRSTDARAWTDLAVDPLAFGGAIGPEPVYAQGRWYAVTDAIYTSADGATWQEAARPPTSPIESPGCPPAEEVTALDLMFLGELAADCYDDTALTFDAWIVVPDGLGGCCWPIGEPAWLNGTIPPGWLSPGPGEFSGSFGVYPVPELADEFGSGGHVRVTGHFLDPAAQGCRRIPLTSFPHRLEARSAVVADCQHRLVIDSVVRLDA